MHNDGECEKLFVVGGDANPPVGYDMDVWSSADGVSCKKRAHHCLHLKGFLLQTLLGLTGGVGTCASTRTPWSPRAGMLTASFDGWLWAMGGQTKGDPDTTIGFAAARGNGVEYRDGKPLVVEIATTNEAPQAGSETAYNDVWRSRDGCDWECVTVAAGWCPRAWVGGSAVLNGRMWVVGGGFIGGYDQQSGTVGYIQDTLIYADPKPTRSYYNDVWSTTDGKECELHHVALRPTTVQFPSLRH